MMQDNRLMPLTTSEPLDRPLRDLTQPALVSTSTSTEGPVHLREYLAVVLKRKWLILSLMVVVTSLVAIQMYRLPSTYEASTQIQIEPKSRSVLQTGRGGDLVIRGNDPNYWNTQLKKLETQKLARQVIMPARPPEQPVVPRRQPGHRHILRDSAHHHAREGRSAETGCGRPGSHRSELSAEQLTPEQARMLEPFEDSLRENLTIEPVDRTNLVVIRFRNTDPEVAAKVVKHDGRHLPR